MHSLLWFWHYSVPSPFRVKLFYSSWSRALVLGFGSLETQVESKQKLDSWAERVENVDMFQTYTWYTGEKGCPSLTALMRSYLYALSVEYEKGPEGGERVDT